MCKFFFVLSFFPEEKNDKAFHSTMLAMMKNAFARHVSISAKPYHNV